MPDLPISGLPVVTVPSNSYTVAAVSASVTSQMTLAEVAAAISSSFTASQAVTASYAVSASYEINIETSSSYADTASYALTASYISGSSNSVSSSYALTASYAISASNAASSSYSLTASYAESSSYAISASYAPFQVSASYALTASYALNADIFPYTGSAIISGSLLVTGSVSTSGSVSATALYAGINGFVIGNGNGNNFTNIAIGRVALDSNTIGTNNLAIGTSAMQLNTSGNSNVAVGQNAMAVNTTGYENTAVGYQSLVSVSTGNNNTVVGANALQVSTGESNTAIGNRAGFYLTSGNNNTFVGMYSGSFGMPALNNNIIISDGTGDVKFWYNSGSSGVIELRDSVQVTGSISQTSVISSLVKANASGQLVPATGGVDYTPTAYLSAYHTASLTVPVANTEYTTSFSTTDFSGGGITISGSYSDKIKVTNAGVYNIQFSAQVDKTNSSNANAYFWLSQNGTSIPWTNTAVAVFGGSNEALVAAWNFYVSASANDYFQLMFGADETNVIIEANTPSVGPQIPSLILTVNRVA